MNAQIQTTRFTQVPAVRAAGGELPVLTPSQQAAYEKLEALLTVTPIVALCAPAGVGRSTIVRQLIAKHGGEIITMQEILEATGVREGVSADVAVSPMIIRALQRSDLVVIDDFTALALQGVTRSNFFNGVTAKHLRQTAAQMGKRLVLTGRVPAMWESVGDLYGGQSAPVMMAPFSVADYEQLVTNMLGAKLAKDVDFKLLYRYASLLNGHQLRMACELMVKKSLPATADAFIGCLEDYILSSNTRTEEVEALSFSSLPGSEHITSKLETHIVLPLENRQLAQRLGLKPKRGVLLYGPPGTGKTSIGRALAHRMKGKFFLSDGAFISEPPGAFFQKIDKVVQEAKENSPSVLFIDDADVLFKIEHIAGLARYLLTLLDGLESQTSSNVCVMMTAMNVKLIPEALLRSGRVELWLETKSPTVETRARILQRWMGAEMPEHDKIDYASLAEATSGFTPADLRRIAGDAKSLYAADIVKKAEPVTATEYVRRAVESIIAVRGRMADSLKDESLRVGLAARDDKGDKKKKYAGMGGGADVSACGPECGW